MENLLNINMFDAVVLGLIVLLSIKGLLSGFAKEFFNSLALIGGIFVASLYKGELAQYIKDNLGLDFSTKLLELISLLVIFFATFIIVKLIYRAIDSFILGDENISTPSRILGMIIKMFTLFFIFSLIVYSLSSKPQVTEKFKDTLDNSKIYPILKNSGSYILNMQSNSENESKSKEPNSDKNVTTTIKDEVNSTKKVEEDNQTNKNDTSEDNTTAKADSNSSK